MMDQLNNWQHGMDYDHTAAVQDIIGKAAKQYARHTHLCALVLKQPTPDDALLVLVEADRCVKHILALMDELEALFEKEMK
jgi:hypothetical protein